MNKKELKELIIRRGGKIISHRKFLYHDKTYYFDYFVKDWKQINFEISRHKIKQEYKEEVKKFSNDEETIEKEEKGSFLGAMREIIDPMFWIMILFIFLFFWLMILYYLFSYSIRFIIVNTLLLFSSKKVEYESLEKRVEDLEKWSQTFPEFYYKKQKPKRKLNWAFEKFIINNYSIETGQSQILTIENYLERKSKLKIQKELKDRKKSI